MANGLRSELLDMNLQQRLAQNEIYNLGNPQSMDYSITVTIGDTPRHDLVLGLFGTVGPTLFGW